MLFRKAINSGEFLTQTNPDSKEVAQSGRTYLWTPSAPILIVYLKGLYSIASLSSCLMHPDWPKGVTVMGRCSAPHNLVQLITAFRSVDSTSVIRPAEVKPF